MKFTIDFSGLLREFDLPKDVFEAISQRAVESATWATYDQLHREANKALRRTRNPYKRNINKPQITRLKGVIVLTGVLPNMVEQGAEPFDIKRGFQSSPKAKKKADGGWFLTIPFRWATPNSLADSEAFSGTMPKEIYEIVKGLPAQRTAFGGQKQAGKGIPKSAIQGTKFGVLRTRPSVTKGNLTAAQKAAYKHKTSIYQGIMKKEKEYEAVVQGSYVSFRRVSDNSDTNSWIHTGIEARNLMPKALQNAQIDVIITKSVSRSLEQLNLL